jgi:hypothetical protein
MVRPRSASKDENILDLCEQSATARHKYMITLSLDTTEEA